MCRFLVSLIFLSIVVCAFARPHHINRRGISILGSFGQGLKDDGFLSNRFGFYPSVKPGTGNRVQIRGHYGGTSNSISHAGDVDLGSRVGETNKTDTSGLSGSQPQTSTGSGCVGASLSESNAEAGIGCESIALNSILENAGLGGDATAVDAGSESPVDSSGSSSQPEATTESEMLVVIVDTTD